MGAAALGVVGAVAYVRWPETAFADYDVNRLVVRGPAAQGLTFDCVRELFAAPGSSGYSPIVELTFAIDHSLWGSDLAGFRLTNALIHVANVLLLFGLILQVAAAPGVREQRGLRRRDVLWSAFAAGLFCLHPLAVEPVAWLPGRAELLMTLGSLGCLNFYALARCRCEAHAGGWSSAGLAAAATACCTLACASHWAGVAVPLLAAALDVLASAPLRLGKLVRGIWLLGLIGAGATVIWFTRPERMAARWEPDLRSLDRLGLVLSVFGSSLKSICWPVGLGFLYSPVEPEQFLSLQVLLGGLALVLTTVLVWWLRRRRAILLGLLWFLLALLPVSQLVAHPVHRADRYLYLPTAGLAVALAGVLGELSVALPRRTGAAAVVTASFLAAVLLGLKTDHQLRTWCSGRSVWENSVRVDGNNVLACLALAARLPSVESAGVPSRGADTAREIDFDDPASVARTAQIIADVPDEDGQSQRAVVLLCKRGCELTRWRNARYLGLLASAYTGLAEWRVNRMDFSRAVENYGQALRADPNYTPALFQLAGVLATCRDRKVRNPERAVELAERGCARLGRPDLGSLVILSAAYASAWRFDEAAAAAGRAVAMAEAGGDRELVEELSRRQELYRKRVPPE